MVVDDPAHPDQGVLPERVKAIRVTLKPGGDDGLDKLLQQLKEAGQEHSQGRFTVDRERSQKLLARYRLEHPESYALHLVAVAVASGATRIEIVSQKGEFAIDFDGQPFSSEELENAHSSLFLSERTPQVVRLQELSIAVQAAASLGFDLLEIYSSVGGVTIGYKLMGDQQKAGLFPNGPGGTALASTSRVVFRKTRPLARLRNVFSLARETMESGLIRGACQWVPARLRLNGQELAAPELPRAAQLATIIDFECADPEALQTRRINHLQDCDATRGIILFHPTKVSALLHLVVNGVVFAQTVSPSVPPVWAVLHCPFLRKDLSQSALLRADVDRLMDAVKVEYFDHLRDLCQNYPALAGDQQIAARQLLYQCRLSREAFPLELHDQFAFRLAKTPIFPMVGGGQASLEQLRDSDFRRHPAVLYTTRKFEITCLDGTPVVSAREPGVLEFLQFEARQADGLRDFGLESGDEALLRAQEVHIRRLSWEAILPTEPRVQEECWVRRSVEGRWLKLGWKGEAGLSKLRQSGQARVTFFLQGRPLLSKTFGDAHKWPEILELCLEHRDFQADLDWRGLADNPGLQEQFHILAEQLVSQLVDDVALAWKAEQVGRPDELRRAMVTWLMSHGSTPHLDELALFPLAVPRWAYREQASLDQVEGKDKDSTLWDEQHTSWAELTEQYGRLCHIPVASRSFPCPPRQRELILLASPWLDGRIDQAFPHRNNYEIELRQAERGQQNRFRWLKNPPVEVRLAEVPALLAKVPLRTRTASSVQIQGEVGVLAGTTFQTSRVEYYQLGRPLGSRFLECKDPSSDPLPAGLSVALDCPQLEPDDSYTGIVDSLSVLLAYNEVRVNLWDLLKVLAEKFPGEGVRRRQLQYQFYNCLSACQAGLEEEQFANVLCLDLVDGDMAPFCQLGEAARSGPINVIVEEQRPEPLEELPSIFWLTPAVFEAFRRWLGAPRLRNCDELYLQHLYQRAHSSRSTEEARLPVSVLLRESWVCALGEGEIGLLNDLSIPAFSVRLRILSKGRLVDESILTEPDNTQGDARSLSYRRPWQSALRVAAVIECPTLGSHIDGPQLQELSAALWPTVRALGFAEAARLPEMSSEDREVLQDYLWIRLAWEARSKEVGELTQATGFTVDQDEISSSMRHTPVFPTATGGWVTLDRLLTEIEGDRRVLYWVGQPPRVPPDDLVILVRRNQLAVFRSILGSGNTADATSLIMARLRAEEFEQQSPVEELTLPPKEYTLTWSVRSEVLDGVVGLLGQFGKPSVIRFYWKQRLLETVKLELDFVIEASLHSATIKPNRDWNAIARDPAYEEVCCQLKENCWQQILSGAPRLYRLQLGVSMFHRQGNPAAGIQASSLWDSPLMLDPWGRDVTLQQLKLASQNRRLFYWTPGVAAPVSPDVVPVGLILPLLNEAEKAVLSPLFLTIEDYRDRALAAEHLLLNLPISEPECQPAAEEMFVSIKGGWLISNLSSDERRLQITWKGRPLPPVHKAGWPGYRAYLRADGFPLGVSGALEGQDHLSELHGVEAKLEQLWMERLIEYPLSSQTAEAAALILPHYGPLADLVRARLRPRVNRQSDPAVIPSEAKVDPWQELLNRLSTALEELHGNREFEISRSRTESGLGARMSGRKVVYQVNFYDRGWRTRIEAMSLEWLVTILWLRVPEEANAPDPRLKHARILHWLASR